ncbi:hypothetical protein StoSoilB19_19870 [Arthrobacter sp. StoSoilB19]|nr:hypothetical protein StoSoilB19_19870 [Arthrobacter sp. StoSoilB19]
MAAATDNSISIQVTLGTFACANAALKVFHKLAELSNIASWLPVGVVNVLLQRYAPQLGEGLKSKGTPVAACLRRWWDVRIAARKVPD